MIFNNSLKQLGLFSFLIAIVCSSCERPEQEVGFNLVPGQDILSAFQTDTFSIALQTKKNDSIYTKNQGRILLGNVEDPVFGQTKTAFYSQISLSAAAPSFPASYQVDSVVLSLYYLGPSYGKFSTFNPEVKELNESLSADSTYLRTSNAETIGENLVDLSSITAANGFSFNLTDSINVGGDSIPPHFRIPLQKSFGERIMAADAANLASSSAFRTYFKGLYVGSKSADGGVAAFDLLNSTSKVRIYYSDLTEQPDTIYKRYYDLVFTSEDVRFYSIIKNYNNSNLEPLATQNEFDTPEKAYAETGGGTRLVVNFTNLSGLKNVTGKVVNRAELIIPYDNDDFWLHPQYFDALRRNDEGDLQLLEDYFGNSISIDGYAYTSPDRYVLNITKFVQAYINGEFSEPELILSPIDIINSGTTLQRSSNAVTLSRVVVHGPEFPSEYHWQRMRLVITYSN